MSKKHVFDRESAEKYISASCGYPLKAWLHIYVYGKYVGVDQSYSRKHRAGESKITLVQLLYQYLYPNV